MHYIAIQLKNQNTVGGDDIIGSLEMPCAELFKGGAGQDGEEKPKWQGWLDLKVGVDQEHV